MIVDDWKCGQASTAFERFTAKDETSQRSQFGD
jgi:hypothetical protein